MSRRKKLRILIPVVIVLFLGAYAKHRFSKSKYIVTGRLQSKNAAEISGIAASAINKDIYYVMNDSGDTSRFFAITAQGKLLCTVYYNWGTDGGIGMHDCEDIATGPGPVKGNSYVYVADIGDNRGLRDYINVYRVHDREGFATEKKINAKTWALHLKYPDNPKDAEAFMVDKVDRLMYIISKRADSVSVYTAPLNFNHGDTVTLTKRCRIFFKGLKPFKWITGGSISKDGQQVLLKSYERVYYWHRAGNEPIWQTLQREPDETPYYRQEKLGEAIGFNTEGTGYYTTSEGVFSPIYYYDTPGFFGF